MSSMVASSSSIGTSLRSASKVASFLVRCAQAPHTTPSKSSSLAYSVKPARFLCSSKCSCGLSPISKFSGASSSFLGLFGTRSNIFPKSNCIACGLFVTPLTHISLMLHSAPSVTQTGPQRRFSVTKNLTTDVQIWPLDVTLEVLEEVPVIWDLSSDSSA